MIKNAPTRRVQATHGWVPLCSERGLTLTELTVVGVLAIVVMLSLIGFYSNAQRMWLETSAKSTTQRDATLLMEVIGRHVHRSAMATVDPSDPNRNRLSLYADIHDLLPRDVFAIDPGDRRIHRVEGGIDLGPVVDSEALQLRFDTVDTNLVVLNIARLISSEGDVVPIATTYQLLGR
jgi:Tfp pilus assembly protein PilW